MARKRKCCILARTRETYLDHTNPVARCVLFGDIKTGESDDLDLTEFRSESERNKKERKRKRRGREARTLEIKIYKLVKAERGIRFEFPAGKAEENLNQVADISIEGRLTVEREDRIFALSESVKKQRATQEKLIAVTRVMSRLRWPAARAHADHDVIVNRAAGIAKMAHSLSRDWRERDRP